MDFDAVELDALIATELLANYWRERAECLEEWVCELLRKNQVLRMALEMEHSQELLRDEATRTSPLLSLYESPITSNWPVFRTQFENLAVDDGREGCPTKQCNEIRKSVVQFAILNEFFPTTNN